MPRDCVRPKQAITSACANAVYTFCTNVNIHLCANILSWVFMRYLLALGVVVEPLMIYYPFEIQKDIFNYTCLIVLIKRMEIIFQIP